MSGEDDAEQFESVQHAAMLTHTLFNGSIRTPSTAAASESENGYHGGMEPPVVSDGLFHPPLMELMSSVASTQNFVPMPALLHSTSSWGILLGAVATATDPTAPPFFNFATSHAQKLNANPFYDTPDNQGGVLSYPPQASSNHQPFGGGGATHGKTTTASLLENNVQQPAPVSEWTVKDMDESNIAKALLDLTPAVLARRVPFADIGYRSANSPSKRLAATNLSQSFVGNSAHAAVVMQKRRLLENVPVTDLACKCKSSKCLKLYCKCFQTGTFCNEKLCKCKQCQNTAQHNLPEGARSIAIVKILHRRIDAFEQRAKKKSGKGCACKKNR
jgi:hypothetical protein